MKLNISDKRFFRYVQYVFSERYPFLKIELLRSGSGEWKPFSDEKWVLDDIDMNAARTVRQLVGDLDDIFGMPMMIMRRSGTLWIETSLTADWTLERQNREGESVCI